MDFIKLLYILLINGQNINYYFGNYIICFSSIK